MNAPPVSDVTAALAERVRQAHVTGTALRITGAGHWLDAGRPCRADESLPLASHTGIVEYEPGDLTMTVRAGTPLDALRDVARREGQWLPLDPFGHPGGTIGATIATASSGPLSAAFGTPRDHVLGCEFITGTGDVVRAGGRVVKNVAGFDLVRLVTGAWGTLGVLTEVSIRLRALPEVDRTLALETTAGEARRWLRASEYTPLAAEMISARLATDMGIGSRDTLLLRLGGNRALVHAAGESAGALATWRDVDSSVWDELRTCEPAGAAVVRLSTSSSQVAALWDRVASIVERAGGHSHATLQRGVVRCMLPVQSDDADELSRLRGIVGALLHLGSSVVERLPSSLWAAMVPPAASDALSIGARRAFDPGHVLNPGILGELA